MSVALLGKIIWLLGLMAWGAIRYRPHRTSRRTPTIERFGRWREPALVTLCVIGMGVVPAAFAVSNRPALANYQPPWIQIALGALIVASSLWLFYRAHKDLGRNFSALLEIRESHRLVTTGVYRWLRHPMYAAFWLFSLAQALLLANWLVALSGIAAVAILYFVRVRTEEQMMIDRFGDAYLDYRARTSRIIPGIF